MIQCFECGKEAHHNHHVIPKSKGGTRTVPLCHDCHALVHEVKSVTMSELTKQGLRRAANEGRTGGRPRVLSEEDIPKLQALIQDPDVSTRSICDDYDISKATLYRYVGPNGEIRYGNS